MRIQVITRQNGFGLSKDIAVLQEALSGHTVEFTDWQRPRQDKWDWNIHLELVNPAQFRTAKVNAFVPNPEWFESKWTPHLPAYDLILAKTRDCERIFSALHPNVVYTGWTSPDPGYRVDYESDVVVHCAGASYTKGTPEVLAAAGEARTNVLVLTHDNRARSTQYVRAINGRQADELFANLRRAPVHLCPSTYEGFGHYINEARAMGAVIVTTDAPPMDELVSIDHGILVPHCTERTKRLATERVVCTSALAEAIRCAAGISPEVKRILGDRARGGYDRDRETFHRTIQALVQ